MYFNKVHSISTERIITHSPSSNTFDIELQQPQPRRRQIIDQNYENDDKEQQLHPTRGYSLPQSEPDQLSLRNNLVTVPASLSTLPTSNSIILTPAPEVVEEK